MAFNIQDFQAQIGRTGYGVTNLFTVEITTAPATGFSQRDLVLYARAATLPEFDLQTEDVAHAGFGSATRKPTGMQFPILPVTFLVDKDHKIMSFFHDWTRKIVNYDRTSGPGGAANGLRPFEINYKSDYQGSLKITLFSRFSGSDSYIYEFSGAYPVNVGSISTAWDSEELLFLPVGFSYDVVKLSSLSRPKVTGIGGGSNSLLTYFSQLNTSVQALRDFDADREIQGLVNQSAALIDQIF